MAAALSARNGGDALPRDAAGDVRPPDARTSMRLVEPPPDEEPDELAWSDSARTQVAVQASALVLASTWASAGSAWQPWCLALGLAYCSATASAQRQRRQPAAFAQVLVACALVACYDKGGGAAFRRSFWRCGAVLLYGFEAVLWQGPTADLVEYAFPRFQHQLFLVLVVATYWGMPLLYEFAERLEVDSLAGATPNGSPLMSDFGPDAIRSRFAGALLYGGTALMLALSAGVWYRMYVLAPELFKVFSLVVASGALAGAVLFLAGFGDVAALSGATATSFAAMARLALDRPGPRRSVAAAAVGLFAGFAKLDRGTFAALCFATMVAVKLHCVADLNRLRGRPRTTARLDLHACFGDVVDAPLANTLAPALAAV